eukprot:440887_1
MHSKTIQYFREREYIYTRNITDLTLQSFGTSSVVSNVAHFHLMLHSLAFDNIQCLRFHYVNCRFDPEQIKQLFPSVTALSIVGGFINWRIALIHEFAKQLKYLCMFQYKNRPHNLSTVQFD